MKKVTQTVPLVTHVYQTPSNKQSNERHLINRKILHQQVILSCKRSEWWRKRRKFKLTWLEQFRKSVYRSFTETLLQIESTDDWSKKKNELEKRKKRKPDKKGILFATEKVAYITAMTILHLILHSTVHIYDFHIFIT